VTRLILLRHGQTDWNIDGRYQGHAYPPLNEVGVAQAHAVAAQLKGLGVTALYSSDLRRARQTAEIIAASLALPVRLDARLREIQLGEWEGLRQDEVLARFPVEWAARQRDPLYSRAPGGESVAEVAARVWAAANEVAHAQQTGSVLIVSHGLALATLLCRARGVPLERARDFIPDNAQLQVIELCLVVNSCLHEPATPPPPDQPASDQPQAGQHHEG